MSFKEEIEKAAKHFAENHVIVNHLTAEEYENSDAAIYNLQSMSFLAGSDKAKELILKKLLEGLERIREARKSHAGLAIVEVTFNYIINYLKHEEQILYGKANQ